MRKAADPYPGKSKTEAREAFIIAETARAMPHKRRAVDRDREVLAALKVLSGSDADLTHQGDQPPALPAAAEFSALERVLPGAKGRLARRSSWKPDGAIEDLGGFCVPV
jgi:hypothetical protein